MSLRRQAVNSVYWTGLHQFGNQFITFIVSIVLARLLLPSEFGLIGMLYVFIALGRSLVDAGLTQSLIRTPVLTDEDLSTVFYFNIFGSVVIYTVCYILAPSIAKFYNQDILTELLRWYGLVFIINGVSSIQNTVLTKELRFKEQFRIQLPSLIIGSVVGVVMAYTGYGVWSLVASALVQSSANSLQLWLYSSWSPKLSFNTESFKTHFGFGYKLTVSGLIATLYDNLYTIIIGKYFSGAQLGYYIRANSLKQLPVTNIRLVLNKVTYPLFAKIQEDDIRLKRVNQQIMKMVVFVVAPVLVISSVLGEPLFRFMLTEKWLPAVPYYQILCIVGLIYPINSYNINVFKVKGKSGLYLRLEIVKKAIGITIVIISAFIGIFALLWGSVLTYLCAFVINSHYVGRLIGYPTLEQIKDLAPLIFSVMIGGLGTFIVDYYMVMNQTGDLIRLLVGTFVGCICYVAAVWIGDRTPIIELLRLRKAMK